MTVEEIIAGVRVDFVRGVSYTTGKRKPEWQAVDKRDGAIVARASNPRSLRLLARGALTR